MKGKGGGKGKRERERIGGGVEEGKGRVRPPNENPAYATDHRRSSRS